MGVERPLVRLLRVINADWCPQDLTQLITIPGVLSLLGFIFGGLTELSAPKLCLVCFTMPWLILHPAPLDCWIQCRISAHRHSFPIRKAQSKVTLVLQSIHWLSLLWSAEQGLRAKSLFICPARPIKLSSGMSRALKHRESSSHRRKPRHLCGAVGSSPGHRQPRCQPGPAHPSITKATPPASAGCGTSDKAQPVPRLSTSAAYITRLPLGFSMGHGSAMNGSLFHPRCGTSGKVSASAALRNSGFY